MNMIANRLNRSVLGRMGGVPDRMLAILGDRGPVQIRIAAQREIGSRGLCSERKTLIRDLSSSVPGVRRSSAWALGQLSVSGDSEKLRDAAEQERVDSVRFELCVAAVRCGHSPSAAYAVVEQASMRELVGAYGSRRVGGYAGYGEEVLRQYWEAALTQTDGGHISSHARAREECGFEAADRDQIIQQALRGDPSFMSPLQNLWVTSGRRMRLTLTMAKGLHGDPRWIPSLLSSLFSVDVDPGHGFALRSEAALALGRIGVPAVGPQLLKAIEFEALDQEGRPGAGLGVQRSVRSCLIAALGELQAAEGALAGYLDNTHGNATGGLYLPAMDALWKVGDRQPLAEASRRGGIAAANAQGVLAAMSV